MNKRMQEKLHRWLPWVAVLSLLVFLSSCLFDAFYVDPRRDREWREVEAALQLAKAANEEALRTREAELRAALERGSAAIETLDGNRLTQEALIAAVAQEESIGEVWVTDDEGDIVYYGRHRPPLRNVENYPLPTLHRRLDSLPEGLLQPMQRTGILLISVLGDYEISSSIDRQMLPMHLARRGKRHVEMRPIRGGLIAAVVSQPPWHNPFPERSERLRLIGNLTTLAIAAGLIAFWLTIPSWMLLDARQRGERAAAWGLFGLLGNVMALVIYLLVRRDPEEETG